MSSDVLGCRISVRITANGTRVVLIETHVVESHRSGERSSQTGKVQKGESTRNTEVENHGHGFGRYQSLSNVAIRSNRSSIKLPGFLLANEPCN